MIPTPSHPLTPAFASVGSDEPSSQPGSLLPPGLDISSSPTLPAGYHPASPRFLLSLLATAVFLSIPSVASQALSAIVRTVGPHTAVRYLNFAIGHGIGSPGDPGISGDGIDRESEAAVGLEEVADIIREDDLSSESIHVPQDLRSERDPATDIATSHLSGVKGGACKHTHGGVSLRSDLESDTDSEDYAGSRKCEATKMANVRRAAPCYYYGAVSDKVGEAAVCWLTRWGIDILRYEEQAVTSESETPAQDSVWSPSLHHVQWAGDRPGSAPPEMTGPKLAGKAGGFAHKPAIPTIWRRGGLSARWLRGILSSDALFVRGEKERYEMAKSAVEMRRAARALDGEGEQEAVEEPEFERLFAEGVYYANMVRAAFCTGGSC